MGPVLIPIKGSNKMVIECDVKPMSEFCAMLVIWCPQSEFIVSKNGQKKVAFVRICTSTQKHRTEERKSLRALEAEVQQNAKRLAAEERNLANERYWLFFDFLKILGKVGKWLPVPAIMLLVMIYSADLWMPPMLQILAYVLHKFLDAYCIVLLPNI